MKRILFYALFVSILFSCQQEEFDQVKQPHTVDFQSSQVEVPTYQDNVDPSILNSDWWHGLHVSAKEFIGMELSNDDKPLSLTELQKMKAKVTTTIAMKTKVCPGYPVANPEGDVTLSSRLASSGYARS